MPSPRFLPASIPCDDQLPHGDGGRDKTKGRTALLGPRPSAGGVCEGGSFRSAQVLCSQRKPPWARLFLGSPRPWSRAALTGNPQGGVRFPSPRPSAPSFMSQSPQPSSGAESLSSPHKPGPGPQRQGAERSHRRTLWASATHSSHDHRVTAERGLARGLVSHPLATESCLCKV